MAAARHTRARHPAGEPRSRAAHSPKSVTGAVVGTPTPDGLLHLQRTAGNRAVVQRVKDAFEAKLGKGDLKLAAPFQAKHVAADEAGAKQVTDDRYQAGKMPPAMAQGKMPNTVASSDTWVDALDTSDTKVDTEDGAWTNDVALKVPNVWQVRWNVGTQAYDVTTAADVPLKAGGYAQATYASKKGKGAKQVTGGKFLVDHIGNG